MTLAERAHMATAVRQAKRDQRGRQLDQLCGDGVSLKRAAHVVGWSYRSARRWRSKAAR